MSTAALRKIACACLLLASALVLGRSAHAQDEPAPAPDASAESASNTPATGEPATGEAPAPSSYTGATVESDVAPDGPVQCIDEKIRDELNARRRYRGVQKRLFQKAGRHELSVMGGLYAADLLSASYLLQGAYTFHFAE